MAMVRLLSAVIVVVLVHPARAETVGDWQTAIAEASTRFGIPSNWIERVMRVESGGQTTLAGRLIRSRAGAIGLMQLMPATWEMMRRSFNLGANPDDPRDNIFAGTAYLRLLYDQFGYPGLFAAYNAGPARFADHLATGRALPGETVAYLGKVAGQPRAGGLSPAEPPHDMLFAIRYGGEPHAAAPPEPPSPRLFAVKQ